MIDRSLLKPHDADSILGAIIAKKIEAVEAREEEKPLRDFERSVLLGNHSLKQAIHGSKRSPALIAEIKRRSPSKGPLRENLSIDEVAAIYDRRASAISVVTDEPFFGGSLDLLAKVKTRVRRPVLLKDFVISEYQVLEARSLGADAILLMASVLVPSALRSLHELARGLKMDALVEAHDQVEIDEALSADAQIIGINNRDLRTLKVDPDRVHRLASHVPEDRTLVAESGIEQRSDVDRLAQVADAALVGTTFMIASDIEAKMIELGW